MTAQVIPLKVGEMIMPWIRANPLGLSSDVLMGIRTTRHLSDMPMSKELFRALFRAGYRYLGEFPYLRPEDIASVAGLDPPQMLELRRVLHYLGVQLGRLAYRRDVLNV